jgi:hypothetical protein
MSNIIDIKTRREFRQNAADITEIKITSASWPKFAVMPAWVVADEKLNKSAIIMQKQGWTVEAWPSGKLMCSHPNVLSAQMIPIAEAARIELMLQEKRAELVKGAWA